MLDEFISQSDKQAEQDDDDIYRQYQEMASRSHENEPVKPNFEGFSPDMDQLKPEMPRFEEYYQSQADGMHPFDRIANSFDESELGNSIDDQLYEEEREKTLYHRELLGRLMGQRITPNEYELLSGFMEDE